MATAAIKLRAEVACKLCRSVAVKTKGQWLKAEKLRNCLVVWEIMCIFAGSKKSFCRKTTDIWTTAKGAKLLVLMGLRLRRRRVLIWVQVPIKCLGKNQKTVFRVGKRGGYLDTKGRSFCLSVVKDGGTGAKIWVLSRENGGKSTSKNKFY